MKRIFIEREKCYGCLTCMFICQHVHRTDSGTLEDMTVVSDIEPRNYSTSAGGFATPIICRHCDDPECVASCMSGALYKHPVSGLVQYDKEKCGKCFMCCMYCPFGLPKPDAARLEVFRCNFCAGVAGGPSCVDTCPGEVLTIREVAKREVANETEIKKTDEMMTEKGVK